MTHLGVQYQPERHGRLLRLRDHVADAHVPGRYALAHRPRPVALLARGAAPGRRVGVAPDRRGCDVRRAPGGALGRRRRARHDLSLSLFVAISSVVVERREAEHGVRRLARYR